MAVTPVRKDTWDSVTPTDIGELARDLRAKLATIPRRRIVEFEGLYTEPMYVGVESNPKALACLRVRNKAAQEAPVLCGQMVHWVWDSGRAKINSIDGMSPGSGLTYMFTFEAVG
jgi:hypothetical protein